MPAAHVFHLVSDWRVEASLEAVNDVLGNASRFPDWWGDVYLEVRELEPGDAEGVGRCLALTTKGLLPYHMNWQARVTESRFPFGCSIEATGDLAGNGTWTLSRDGACVDIHYDWQVRAERPLLRRLSPIMRPFFAANHRWAMARGLDGLRRELGCRREV